VIVWLNGAFGAGKTATVRELQRLLPGSHVFDPEDIGTLLRGGLLPAASLDGLADYQDLVAWRRLVPDALTALHAQLGDDVVVLVPMALHRQDYRDEIFGTLASCRIDVHHVLLHADETVLPWLRADAELVDTADLTPRQAAEQVLAVVRAGTARAPIVQDPVERRDTVAAAVLFFDEAERVLLVDPVYKAGWEFPGGVVETGESPSAAAVREAAEELGLALRAEDLRLLVVDWEPKGGPRSGGLRLVFDGGRLGPAEVAALTLPTAELRAWRFVPAQEWDTHLAPNKSTRLRAALAARAAGHVAYLEAGSPR
jgi:8-oxo-dGTP pyrophosphatase MutT (NUDIX family)